MDGNAYLGREEGRAFVTRFGNLLAASAERKKFGLVGVFGTKEIGHDIDFLFYPGPGVQRGEFLGAQLSFLQTLKEREQKDCARDVIPFPMLELQDEVSYLSGRSVADVFLHNLVFADAQALAERVPFLDDVINSPSFEVLHGSRDALGLSRASGLDFYYFTLANSNVLLSNYPMRLLSQKLEHIVGYVRKHALGQDNYAADFGSSTACAFEYTSLLRALDNLDA